MSKNQTDSQLQVGKEFLGSYKGKGHHTHAYRVLRRIFEFACSSEAIKDDDGLVIFSWRDIKTSGDEDDEGKRLKKHINTAIEKWSLHSEALNQSAVDKELEHYPTIELSETGGGSGNLTKYRIKLCPISLNTAVDKSTLKEGYISYTAEVSDTTNPLIRFVDGLAAKGLKLYMLVGAVISAIVIGLLTILAGLYLIQVQTTLFGLASITLDIAFIVGAIYLMFAPLYHCITNRIIIAPSLLSPLEHYSSQLEYALTDEKHSDGKPIRQFKIVSYVGECMVCGGRVDVEKGKGRMSGRLVGRCNESPIEHEYSFDHKTKLGKLIHTEYLGITEK